MCTVKDAYLWSERYEEIFDDQEALSFVRAPSPNWSEAPPPGLDRRILALVARTVVSMGIRVAAVTSIINGLNDSPVGNDWNAMLLAHLPILPDQNLQLIERLIASDLELEVLIAVQELRTRLALANSLSLSFAKFPADIRHKGGVHIEVLAGLWTDLCETIIRAVEGMHAAQGAREMTAITAREAGFVALLKACADGGSPCVMTDGSIEIPGMAERRDHVRWVVELPATLLLGPVNADAILLNISRGGCCLTTDEPLNDGEIIAFQFESGRKLSGKIMWTQEDRYGVKFSVPLEWADALLPQH